jgi:serine/threonine-protein kinase RsbW
MPAESWTMSASPAAPGLARRLTRAYAARHGVEPDTLAAIALCVSEAVTNAVVHAYHQATEPGQVEVEVHKPDSYLCVYVRDQGQGLVPRVDSPGIGIGLPLISNTATSTEVRTPEHGDTEVVMRFDLSQTGGTPAASGA